MNIQHKELAGSRWGLMPLCEQMAHIGSEVSRALNWRGKKNDAYEKKALCRALELLNLSLSSTESYPRLKELARVKEALLDYFYGSNEFVSSETLWRKYFDHFNHAVRGSH